ncbi:MAG: hypothetical protein O3B73_03860, partial [bacterium]|nr:hypothetical protein [bacterium]
MMEDIGPLLKNWPFSQDNSIRKIIDEDGTEKIQVRVDQGAFQGILQMELDGRPDGHKPHRSPFLLDYFQNKRDQYVEKNGKDEGFELTESNCAELFDESRQIYERYVFLLQMQDYDRVIQDTERNMDLFRYVNHYAAK